MQQVPQASLDFYRHQQQIAAATVGSATKLWRRMDQRRFFGLMSPDFNRGWAEVGPQINEVVRVGRAAAAASAAQYTPALLAETGQVSPAFGSINTVAFLASAPDGRSMSTLLDESVVHAKTAVKNGASASKALSMTETWLSGMLLTVMADTRRGVVGADIAQRPAIAGYTRMLNAPSCSRCVILAGRYFKWNQGFQRHPRCIPAGVTVSLPGLEAATKRWYEGELVVFRTASGNELPVTGNHPVLTPKGWVPANLLQEGDYVVRSLTGHVAPTTGSNESIVNKDNVPSLIEDVWSAHSVGGVTRVPGSAHDFHGDGFDSEVHVVTADRLLSDRDFSPFRKPVLHPALSIRNEGKVPVGRAAALSAAGASHQFGLCAEHSLQGGAELGVSLGPLGRGDNGGHSLGSLVSGFEVIGQLGRGVEASDLDAFGAESVLNGFPGDAIAFGEFGGADPAGIFGNEFSQRQNLELSSWDAPAEPFSVETAGMYASVGSDLLERLAGQVELDRVVHVERKQWAGHVYNLDSVEGWYSAANIILSNCDCIHVPAASKAFAQEQGFFSDPYEYFKSLSKEQQEKVFGRIEARAIRDGADIVRVENIKLRGLATAKGNLRYGTPSRMTVDDIYRTAGTRTNVIRMMEQEGYITKAGQVPTGAILGQREGFGALGKGGKARAASDAVTAAGVRDPLNRYTMTSAERRLYDAQYRLNEARATGMWPRSVGENSADRYTRPRVLAPGELATLEKALQNEIVRLHGDPLRGIAPAPDSVQRLARLLGIL